MTDDAQKNIDNNKSTQDSLNSQNNTHRQAKQLKIISLCPADSINPGGFIFRIIDNDGVTILKEYWEPNQKIGIQFCRNWLKIKSGEDLGFTDFSKEVTNAESK